MRDFRDRNEAGSALADALQAYAKRSDVVVVALPRGGVVVGYEIATRLGLPLDVIVVRKLGVPGRSELAMGALASGGVVVIDRGLRSALRVSPKDFEAVLAAARAELQRREQLLRSNRPPLDVRDKTVLLVDDGIATGATMRAGIEGLRRCGPARIVVAVPVASPESCAEIRPLVDELICLLEPPEFYAVGLWYVNFSQTTDSEVRALLDAAAGPPDHRGMAVAPG